MAKMKRVSLKTAMGPSYRIDSSIGNHHLIIDQPEFAGGTDAGPTPLEYFLLSIAGCIATISRTIAKQKRIILRDMNIDIVGDLDVDVLLGKSKENRAGFHSIQMNVSLDADLTISEKLEFLKEVEERCPVSENVINLTPIEVAVIDDVSEKNDSI